MKKLIRLVCIVLSLSALSGCAATAVTNAGTSSPQAVKGYEGKYVVSASYVKEKMDQKGVLLVDARGEDTAKKGTVKGAIAVMWQMFADVTNGKPGDAMWGTLLEPAALGEALSKTGISKDKEIIVFASTKDGWGEEGRITWGLLAAGFPNVKMVDGGYAALVAAGVPTVNGAAPYTPAEVTISAIDVKHIINTEELVGKYDGYKILDVRADEEYEGQALHGEAAGGRLPGAIHVRFTDLFNSNGLLKSKTELAAMFEAAGLKKDDKIVAYCTKGIRSAYAQLILEMEGFENTWNYDESFYRWSASQDLEK